MSNCVFNFNILALVLSGILGWSQIYIRGPCAPRRTPSKKNLKCAQVLAYIYIIINFQLRSSIPAGLTERSLYNRFALKNQPKWGFWGIFWGGAKIFGGNPPRNAMAADLRRLVKKLWRYYKYPSLYTRQRNYKKTFQKTECLRREGYISPLCSAYPPKPLVIPWCMLGPMGDVITHALFQLNRFRG